MAKVISEAHQRFINEVVTGLPYNEAFRVTIGSKGVTDGYCRKKGSELAAKYAIQIQQAKETRAKDISDAKSSEVAQNALKSILTLAEVDAKLCVIIETAKYEGDRLRAIDTYYRRFGSNAPVKTAQTDVEGNNVAPVYNFISNGTEPVKE